MRRISLISIILAIFVVVPVVAQEVTVLPADSVVMPDSSFVALSDSLSVVQSDSLPYVLPDSLSFINNIDMLLADEENNYVASLMLMPLIFDDYEWHAVEKFCIDTTVQLRSESSIDNVLVVEDTWVERTKRQFNRIRAARFGVMIERPDLVRYNTLTLPKAPQELIIVNDPTKQTITIVDKSTIPVTTTIEAKPVKVKRWRHSFSSNIQFSQVYVSPNWYQGGTSSLNLLSDQLFTFNYNDPSGKVLFENLVQWKFNLTTSSEDTVNSVRVSEDLFQINSKFGYKAFGKWYYSASMLFKTQILTNYAPNSYVKEAEFLSPGELNVGVGMSYSFAYEKPVKLSHTLTIAPLSYNLRFVALPNINPTKFGINNGRTRNEVGSSLDYTLTWDIRYNIRWMSHLYAFTNYDNVLVEWTNSIDFSFSNYFSTRLYLDLRYDSSVAPDPRFGYLQIKELISLGFSYKF